MDTPLREPTFLILAALAREPLHGCGIIGEVAAISEGRLSLRPGTLYGALDRLVDAGMVEVHHEEIVEGRLRRYYRLSPAGETTLVEETNRLRRNVEAATGRQGRTPRRVELRRQRQEQAIDDTFRSLLVRHPASL